MTERLTLCRDKRLSLNEIAREFNVHPHTVNRWRCNGVRGVNCPLCWSVAAGTCASRSGGIHRRHDRRSRSVPAGGRGPVRPRAKTTRADAAGDRLDALVFGPTRSEPGQRSTKSH